MFSIYFVCLFSVHSNKKKVPLEIPKLSQNLRVGRDFEVLLCKLVSKRLQGK